MGRIVMHCDMDRFFASVAEKDHPAYRRRPIAICGNPAMRHTIVMSANAPAKACGVRAGLRYADARQLCPDLCYVEADYDRYLAEAAAARAVYARYADAVVPYGMDEAWLIFRDLPWKEAEQIAELIRLEIKYTMVLSASLGVADNLIFAKIGSDLNKPGGIAVITPENYRQTVWPLPASALLFVGDVREQALRYAGIRTVGDVAQADPAFLTKRLKSKVGYDLWQFANGRDRSFDPAVTDARSLSHTITPPADLRSNEEAGAVVFMLASTIGARLKKHGTRGKTIGICLRDSQFNKKIRQCTLPQPTDSINLIFNRAYGLFLKHWRWDRTLRSVGLRIGGLDDSGQLSLFAGEDAVQDAAAAAARANVRRLTARLGKLKVERTASSREW